MQQQPAKQRYKVVDVIGSGGMGDVYRAIDGRGGCEVAIKMLRAHFQPDARHHERFRREVALLSRITHRNVVQVFDSGNSRGRAFFTMEYVDGSTLRSFLKHGPLAPTRAVEIAAELADGLRAVHEVGVIHRDIKAENVMMDKVGTPRLMDFGLAILTEGIEDNTRITGDGQIVGTISCLPPEVVQGEDYDIRSDVYQLAIVLYEMLTGKHPLGRVDVVALVNGSCHEDITPPSLCADDVDGVLSDLIMCALAVDPAHRPQTAAEFRDSLMAWLAGRGCEGKVRRRYSGRYKVKALNGPSKSRQSISLSSSDTNLQSGAQRQSGSNADSSGAQRQRGSNAVSSGGRRRSRSGSGSSCARRRTGSGSGSSCARRRTGSGSVSSCARRRTGSGSVSSVASPASSGVITNAFPSLVPFLHGSWTTKAAVMLLVAFALGGMLHWPLAATQRSAVASDEATKQSSLRKSASTGSASPTKTEKLPAMASLLHRAAWYGDMTEVLRLLEGRVNVDARDVHDRTPLHYALRRGHIELAFELIEGGATVTVADEDGITPLHEAAATGHIDIVRHLLAAGADRAATGREGDTPAFWAACKGHSEIASLLED